MLKTQSKRTFTLVLCALGMATPALADDPPSDSGTLSVSITDVQNEKGQIGCSLFASEEGFPSDPKQARVQVFVKPRAGKATCTFSGVKPGTYAVSVMHDENKDGELETSFVGRPKEWWGVSNDVPAERFGPPKYEKAKFKYTGDPKTIAVKLQL